MSQTPTPSAEIFSDTEEGDGDGDNFPKENCEVQPMHATSAQYAEAQEPDESQPMSRTRSARTGKAKSGR